MCIGKPFFVQNSFLAGSFRKHRYKLVEPDFEILLQDFNTVIFSLQDFFNIIICNTRL
jgi:hypothetical protein